MGDSSAALDKIAVDIRAGAPDAIAHLRDAVIARRHERGDHARWGRLCEQAGEIGRASCRERVFAVV